MLRILGVATLLVALLASLNLATAAADPTGGFGAAPAHPDPNDPATRAYFKATVAPGGTYIDAVQVTSASDAPLSLLISPVDGLTGQTSGAVYANRDVPIKKAGAWVTPSISALNLAPHAQTLVPFTVRVPAGATPGDHLAGIAIENAAPQQATAGQFSVKEILRTVIGVEILVPGPATPAVRLGKMSLRPLPGTHVATLTIALGDPGRLLVKPHLTVTLRGPGGYHHKVARQLDTILPGDTIHYPFLWPDSLITGTYHATVVATGGDAPITETATLQLGHILRGTTNPTVPSTSHDLRWIVLLAVTVVFLLVVAVAWRRRARRRDRRAARRAPAHPADVRVHTRPGRARADARKRGRPGRPREGADDPAVEWRAETPSR